MYSFKDKSGDVLRVLGERVLVEMDVVPDKTESGILYAEDARDKMQGKADSGKIASIGELVTGEDLGCIEYPMKIGDIVYLQRFCGISITIDEKPYKIVQAEDIYATLTRGNK